MNHHSHNNDAIYIHGCGFNSAMGRWDDVIHQCLITGVNPAMTSDVRVLNNGKTTVVGRVAEPLAQITHSNPHYQTRNNRLAWSALQSLQALIDRAKDRYGANRIAVVVGSSTSGIADGEQAFVQYLDNDEFPQSYHYYRQELANLNDFVSDILGVSGPSYTVSTACSSSGRVYLSARNLLRAGLADAVIVGGCDTLCQLTLNGFNGLNALSGELCRPFEAQRNGINIGEAAAFTLLSLKRDDSDRPLQLLGAGDSSDAHHMSAPEPEGKGALEAMQKALEDAGLTPEDVGYINAHGTATALNDAMESKAIARLFGNRVPVSSTKPLTGHTLGAASATEAAICWHILQYQLPLPKQALGGEIGADIADIQLVTDSCPLLTPVILSNSFAFGGNNISLIFGYPYD
ncbi:MAG: beta-ketoacyl-[acyl-carrier-protein] synthase family protein [Shewanella sp.]|nr:beta-ketoacyl-[acyl-carrier-protein] synthase family protein [Shewanella sp.]MCF1431108.1 beta-ketoacyl-[acyl-carrier-protein] synthase family protein [Shewanella sp.]MCF1458684.1 beta-ketoacyl-[acyl-carrier-protein] synthase family protein [Shewanella sp.]